MTTAPPPQTLLDLIGNTPLVRVTRLDTGPCELFLKLETVDVKTDPRALLPLFDRGLVPLVVDGATFLG